MTKIKEIIHTYNLDANRRYKNGSFTSAMKEYATWYAKECLKIAAISARLRVRGVTSLEEYYSDHIYSNDGLQDFYVGIDVDSILNIKLPDHD